MGCDIHAVVELQDDRGNWHCYHIPDIDRNYILFGRMAGVRSDEYEPIAEPRGMPGGTISLPLAILLEKWAGDAHTHSWLTIDEMAVIEKFAEKVCGVEPWRPIFGYCFGNGWRKESLPAPFVDARCVFFFDN